MHKVYYFGFGKHLKRETGGDIEKEKGERILAVSLGLSPKLVQGKKIRGSILARKKGPPMHVK